MSDHQTCLQPDVDEQGVTSDKYPQVNNIITQCDILHSTQHVAVTEILHLIN